LSINIPSSTQTYTFSLHDALPISSRLYKERFQFGANFGQSANALAASRSFFRTYITSFAASTVHSGKGRSSRVKSVGAFRYPSRSEEHTSELQSRFDLVCRLLLDK